MRAQNGTKKMSDDFRDFIHVFGRKRPCFHKQANLIFLQEKQLLDGQTRQVKNPRSQSICLVPATQ